tara:strand:+ start:156 stop:401 length:246 start_codon:yes stop_codon:yes gene_type:complete
MEINWIVLGWIIDMFLNGITWFLIILIITPILGILDDWVRKILESSLEWMRNNGYRLLSSLLFIVILGILVQINLIPKIIH